MGWKHLIGQERERLGGITGNVAKARHGLEVDMPQSPTDRDIDLSARECLTVLQQTHQATLASLSVVTDKYQDSWCKISDLATQIQEAKLQTVYVAWYVGLPWHRCE